jgi:hypothetical protein
MKLLSLALAASIVSGAAFAQQPPPPDQPNTNRINAIAGSTTDGIGALRSIGTQLDALLTLANAKIATLMVQNSVPSSCPAGFESFVSVDAKDVLTRGCKASQSDK